jgi:hypothetical protein
MFSSEATTALTIPLKRFAKYTNHITWPFVIQPLPKNVSKIFHCDYIAKYFFLSVLTGEPGSSVGKATVCILNDRGVVVLVPVGSIIFGFRPNRLWGPLIFIFNGYLGALSQEIKRQEREADHSPPTNAEIRKKWIFTFTSPYAFIA